MSLETSPTTAALDDALVKAQSQIKHASKEGINPHFKSKYADLGSVFDACREALTKAGIAVTQWPVASDDSRLHLITRLSHKGEWMQCKMGIPMDKQNAHGVGSAITYARRYALSAALGIVADEDDDGNAASRTPAKRQMDNIAAEAVRDGLAKDTTSTYQVNKRAKAIAAGWKITVVKPSAIPEQILDYIDMAENADELNTILNVNVANIDGSPREGEINEAAERLLNWFDAQARGPVEPV